MADLKHIGVLTASQFVGVGLGEVAKKVKGETAGQPNSTLIDLLVFGIVPAAASVTMKNLNPDLRTALAVIGSQRIALNVANMALGALPGGGVAPTRAVSFGVPVTATGMSNLIQVNR